MTLFINGTPAFAELGDTCTIMAPGYDTCATSGEVCVAPYGSEQGYCDTSCGNNQCEQNEGENYTNCPDDCDCGNGVCDYGERGSCGPKGPGNTQGTPLPSDCFCNNDNTCDTQQGENQARCGIDECGCDNGGINDCEGDRGENQYTCGDCALPNNGYCSVGEEVNFPESTDCMQVLCGNGQVDPGEVCDKSGNVGCELNQGCSSDCQFCDEIPVCGNGIIETQLYEQCDTASSLPNQGCSAGNTCTSLINGSNGTPFCHCMPNTPVPPGDASTCEISLTDCGMDCYSNNKPFDVFFVMDRSYSMVLGAKLNIMKTSFNSIIDALPAGSRASLITFNHAATIRNTLTTNLSSVRSWNPVNPSSPDYPVENSLTNYVDAFAKLTQEVNAHKTTFSGRNQLVYFFSDGEPTIGGPFVTQGPTQNGGNCSFGVVNGQIVWTCSVGCDIPNDGCQYISATAAADAFHDLFSGLQTIAIGLDISQQHHYILANHVATPGLFSAIDSSVGISQVPKTPCYPYMQGYPNCTQPGPWTTQAFCASINQPINPLNKFVDQFCEMTCEPALCKVYTGNFTQQPAYDTPTGCIGGTYSDLPDTSNQWNWQCTGTDGSTHTCAAGQEPTGPMCHELTVVNLTGAIYEFTCNGTGSNYSIVITDQQGQQITTLQGPIATYTFQTGGTFIATCFVDGVTGLICPDSPSNPTPGIPTHGSNVATHNSPTIDGNTLLNNTFITNISPTANTIKVGSTIRQPIANEDAYNTAVLQNRGQQILASINSHQISEVKPNYIVVFAPPPPDMQTATPCYNPCQKTISIVIPEPEIFDLALKKTLPDSVAGHAPGGFVTFDIEVINQGNVPAQGIIISDYVPVGLTLQDPTWSYDANTRIAKKSYDSILNPGESALLTITFVIDANASGALINRAEIMTDNGVDIDSIPDNNQVNDCFGGDNIVTGDGSGTLNTPKCTPETDEDDHDPAQLQVQVPTIPVYDLRIRKDIIGSGSYAPGSEVTYRLTVLNTGNITASGLVTDILPMGLSYTGGSIYSYAPIQGGVTITAIGGGQRQISNIAPGQLITITYSVIVGANATGTLTNNVTITPIGGLPPELVPDTPGVCIPGKNPLVSDSSTNPNNAVVGTNNRDCEEITITLPVYDLRINKEVTSTGSYTIGSKVTYKVTIMNTGNVIASGTVKDILPVGLSYTGSATVSNPNVVQNTTIPGEWKIVQMPVNSTATITYSVIVGANATGTLTNNVTITPIGGLRPELVPDTPGVCVPGKNPLVSDSSTNPNNAVAGTNNRDCEEITLSEGMSCVASVQPDVTVVKSNTHTMQVQCDVTNMTGMVSVDCGNGTSGTILSGKSTACTYTTYGTYTATCLVNNTPIPNCAKSVTLEKGGTGDPSSICISITPTIYTVVAKKHDVDVTCAVDGVGYENVSIDCGNGKILEKTTKGTCELRGYGTYSPVCLVNGKKVEKCQTTITLKGGGGGGGTSGGGSTPVCGNEKIEHGEQCDAGTENGSITSLCRKDCTMKGINPDPCDDPKTSLKETCIPQCSFIDPPSIQMGEYLPFWWDIDDTDDTIQQGRSCNEDAVGSVVLDTMQCHFSVLAPGGKEYPYVRSCTEDNLKSVGWYADIQKDLRTKIMPRRGQSILDSSLWKETGFGEYAIALQKITYDVCAEQTDSKNKKSYKVVAHTYEGRVCQFNFAITAPYMMQKGSSLSSLADDRSVLERFRLLDGSPILRSIDAEHINFLTKKSNTNTFAEIKKIAYEQLKTVVSKVEPTHPLAPLTSVVRKSPSQEVYMVESDAIIEHTSPLPFNRGKATTLIVKGNYTVTIKGSLPANLLLIAPEGTIVFRNMDCDNNDIVEGIILANKLQTSSSRGVFTNTLLKDPQRCNGGQLIIKGIIVTSDQDTLSTVRNQRRSTLQKWFDGSMTKKEHIYAGASLRIDTNSNQRSKLPPLAQQTSLVFKLQSKDGSLTNPVYLDAYTLPFYLQMMLAVGEVSEVNP